MYIKRVHVNNVLKANKRKELVKRGKTNRLKRNNNL